VTRLNMRIDHPRHRHTQTVTGLSVINSHHCSRVRTQVSSYAIILLHDQRVHHWRSTQILDHVGCSFTFPYLYPSLSSHSPSLLIIFKNTQESTSSFPLTILRKSLILQKLLAFDWNPQILTLNHPNPAGNLVNLLELPGGKAWLERRTRGGREWMLQNYFKTER